MSHPHKIQRRLLIGLAIGATLPAWARTQVDGRWLRLEVQDRDSGETLPVHTAADGQRYVAGRPGARYGITIRNLRRERILVVMSVDGVNVLSGQTAGWDQGGYVLGPLGAGQIAGWRKSDREVAAFEFVAPGDSYAARTGRPLDLGVIGVAVFGERRPEPRPLPVPPPAVSQPSQPSRPSASTQDRAASGKAAPAEAEAAAPAAASSSDSMARRERSDIGEQMTEQRAERSAEKRAEQKLGTGHGQREESIVTHTRFERARSTPDEVIALRYDSRANLIRMGVIVDNDERLARPRAFPRQGYVPDPPRF